MNVSQEYQRIKKDYKFLQEETKFTKQAEHLNDGKNDEMYPLI
jgi:hypothetical protein